MFFRKIQPILVSPAKILW